MNFRYSFDAVRQFTALPRTAQERISKKMRFFAKQPDPLQFAHKLTGYKAFRFRIGEYRVIFEAENEAINIIAVLKRDEAYRDL